MCRSKSKDGEDPVKCGGRVFMIDGGFSRAYQPTTGIAGYTLIDNSYEFILAAHEPLKSAAGGGGRGARYPLERVAWSSASSIARWWPIPMTAPISAAASRILSSCWRRIGTARSPRAGADAETDGLPYSAVGALLRGGAPIVAFTPIVAFQGGAVKAGCRRNRRRSAARWRAMQKS